MYPALHQRQPRAECPGNRQTKIGQTPVEGESLRPWLRDPSLPRTRPAVVTYLPGNHSVVHEQWNYIRYSDGSEELYDHTTDPAEFHNLIAQPASAAIVAKLRPWLPVTPAADFKTNKRTDN